MKHHKYIKENKNLFIMNYPTGITYIVVRLKRKKTKLFTSICKHYFHLLGCDHWGYIDGELSLLNIEHILSSKNVTFKFEVGNIGEGTKTIYSEVLTDISEFRIDSTYQHLFTHELTNLPNEN